MDPPVSEPRAPRHMSAATTAADPPLDPPGTRDRSQGFLVIFKPEFSVDQSFEPARVERAEIQALRESYLKEAEALARELEKERDTPFMKDDGEIEELKTFYYVHRS